MKHRIVMKENKFGKEEPFLEYFDEYYSEVSRQNNTILYRKPHSNFFLITNLENEVLLAFKTSKIEIYI